MNNVYLCPVCEGKGLVPKSFYSQLLNIEDGTPLASEFETCRSCSGKGFVVVDDCDIPNSYIGSTTKC